MFQTINEGGDLPQFNIAFGLTILANSSGAGCGDRPANVHQGVDGKAKF
ncbi:hypothetical protein [Endozoicomonas sp. YOMI1]|nr:hypothetical protein [Endozoicomonas sp. YOMI1]